MTLKMGTFTVMVPVYEWMKSESDPSKQLLLNYLEDIAESMDFRNQATAAAMQDSPSLWFTFASEEDANDFHYAINTLYNLGGWLSND